MKHTPLLIVACLFLVLAVPGLCQNRPQPPQADKPILLVDDAIVGAVVGDLNWRPVPPRPVAAGMDSATNVALPTIIRYENHYRLYGYQSATDETELRSLACVSSTDGRTWHSRHLSKLRLPLEDAIGFTPFLDERPSVNNQQRWKALAGSADGQLFALVSNDGLQWSLLSDKPVIVSTADQAFYGRNGVVWSDSEQAFVLFFSAYQEGRRIICRSISEDLLHWSDPVPLKLNLENEDVWSITAFPLETNPPVLLALLTRTSGGNSGPADACLAVSRNEGKLFRRWFPEAWIRPLAETASWSEMVASPPQILIQPSFHLPEQFFYVGRQRYQVSAQRYIAFGAPSYPLELHEPGQTANTPAELVTHEFVVRGNALVFNLSTNSTGGLRAEFLDEQDRPIPGYTRDDFISGSGYIWVTADAEKRAAETAKFRGDLERKGVHRVAEIYGDDEALRAGWRYLTRGNPANQERIQWWPDWDIGPLEGRTVRLRILLHGADLFGFQTVRVNPQEGVPVHEKVIP